MPGTCILIETGVSKCKYIAHTVTMMTPSVVKNEELLYWCFYSLLNTVYKIGSGVIAKRFKTVLDKLIDFDQTGFISGRYIGENLRLIYDITCML